MEKNGLSALGLLLAIGLVASAFLVSGAINNAQNSNRFVTVRGLSEKDVKANLAMWRLKFKTTGDDLAGTQAALETQKKAVVEFLTKAGFSIEELQPQGIRVVDKQANEYGNDNAGGKRFVMTTSVLLRTEKVDLVMKTQQKMSDLINSGVVLSDDNYCGNTPNYLFTKLNDIKIEMLADATKNARSAAGQFAKDAEAKVGSIRQASQGYFSISALDRVEESSGGDSSCGDGESIMKKIRVVSTVDYYLE
jgi:hypothetical protein